jgi:hypothetical protein
MKPPSVGDIPWWAAEVVLVVALQTTFVPVVAVVVEVLLLFVAAVLTQIGWCTLGVVGVAVWLLCCLCTTALWLPAW